jgi:6-pyruvoyltetrahydropterin/6-carboxytetrahydropterin synthase
MFELEKTFHFEAGHVLSHHDGKCREPHGHSYVLTVHVRSPTLIPSGPKKNMVIDFQDINHIVRPLIKDSLDHKWLNDTLSSDSPTVEYIAKWIYDYLKPHLPGLYAISMYETATSKVTYTGPSPTRPDTG